MRAVHPFDMGVPLPVTRMPSAPVGQLTDKGDGRMPAGQVPTCYRIKLSARCVFALQASDWLALGGCSLDQHGAACCQVGGQVVCRPLGSL